MPTAPTGGPKGPVACAAKAVEVIATCRALAMLTETAGATTRTFLSPPMHAVHARLSAWMTSAGMTVSVDAVGNLRGVYPGGTPTARRLIIGSHLDTIPGAGAFDGILGVVVGLALVDMLQGVRLPYEIEVIGFSEEEGVRFGVPFIGSRALAGTVDDQLLDRRDANGIRVRDAIVTFGLDVSEMRAAVAPLSSAGYLEFHIEQGPVLDSRNLSVGVVTAIAGQSRLDVTFSGMANHAGTTPMNLRRDALAGAAEWVTACERQAGAHVGLVATVGRLEVLPGATNVIAGRCRASLDVRHADDRHRHDAVDRMLASGHEIASRRQLAFSSEMRLDQAATPLDPHMTTSLERAVEATGLPLLQMVSGAGHDAMVLAPCMPAAMLFLRSPDGISHHPDESVQTEDVAAALAVGLEFLNALARS